MSGSEMTSSAADREPTAVFVLPSGLKAELYDVVETESEVEGRVLRLRFVVPELEISDAADDQARLSDMEFLCGEAAVGLLGAGKDHPEKVVIAMAPRRSEFGERDPSLVQFFEAFSVSGGVCTWEFF